MRPLLVLALLLVAPLAHAQDTTLTPDSTALVADSLSVFERLAQESDALTERELQRIFVNIPAFQGIEVDVNAGVARLSGSTVQPGEAEDAVALAQGFEGVVYVVNDLATEIEVEARVAPAVERLQGYLNSLIEYLPILGVAVLVLLIFGFIASRIGRRSLFQRWGLSPIMAALLQRLLKIVVWGIGFVLAFDILGVTALVGALLGTAGLVGIAVGFAFQDIVENYLAGLLMSLRQPFNLNDHIKVGEQEGKVIRLTARELVLMTLEGNHLRIPNGTVFKSTVLNYTRNPRRRFSFKVGVDVNEDLTQVQRIGLDTLNAMPGVMDDPAPFMLVDQLGDSNVTLSFFGWVDQTEASFGKVRSEAIRLVKTALDEADVLMPEPIYNVRMEQVNRIPSTELAEKNQQHRTPRPPAHEQAKQADVSVETELDQQILDDLTQDDEPNLLSSAPATA